MKKIKYYLNKLFNKISIVFSFKRIKQYGLKFALYDFLIFMLHRKNSMLEHRLIQKKDYIVQKYLYDNYSNFINSLRGK